MVFDRESRGVLSVLFACALAFVLLVSPARADAAVPLIVDTDIFSDVDDVGALATAFGLQYRGEAKVIAVAVNTRTSRPAVATNSWQCVAAITHFYGSRDVPIGTAMPNDGTSSGDAGFAGPCAAKGPASVPAPGDAVDVYRQALASQPDHSVVIVSVGYLGNLSALIHTAADHDLVAQKVKELVVMGGSYPSGTDETNLDGDPAAAQNVSAHWPTKIVWAGYEIGDRVLTGGSIPLAHPADSPVRAAFENFVEPATDTTIKSWDLTATYHAVRPDDPVMTEVGPGTNTITDNGDGTASNQFTMDPAGNQYYLELSSAAQLGDKLETLLDTLSAPPPPPSEPPPPADQPPLADTRPSSPPRAADPQPPGPPVTDPPPPEHVTTSVPPRSHSKVHCVVPTLKGRTLAGARKLLRRHHCALGRVTKRRTKRRRLVVRQSLPRRTVHRAGTPVDLTLRLQRAVSRRSVRGRQRP